MYIPKIRFYLLRRNRTSDNDILSALPVYMSVRFEGSCILFSTGEKVKTHEWDSHLGRVGIDHADYQNVNTFLDHLERSALRLLRSVEVPVVFSNPALFKKALRQEVYYSKASLNDAYFRFLDECSGNWGLSTFRKFKSTYNQLQDFSNKTGSQLTLTAFDSTFFQSFVHFLRHIKGQAESTIRRYLETIFTWLTWADRNGYNVHSYYREYRKVTRSFDTSSADLPVLHDEEIKKLMDIPVVNAEYAKYRLLFAVCCLTGLRTKEIRTLSSYNYHDGVLSVPGQVSRNIPVSPANDKLVHTFLGMLDRGEFGSIYGSRLNTSVRAAACEAGLTRQVSISRSGESGKIVITAPLYTLISMETARRTFLSRLTRMSVPVSELVSISGCTSPSSLNRYLANRWK